MKSSILYVSKNKHIEKWFSELNKLHLRAYFTPVARLNGGGGNRDSFIKLKSLPKKKLKDYNKIYVIFELNEFENLTEATTKITESIDLGFHTIIINNSVETLFNFFHANNNRFEESVEFYIDKNNILLAQKESLKIVKKTMYNSKNQQSLKNILNSNLPNNFTNFFDIFEELY